MVKPFYENPIIYQKGLDLKQHVLILESLPRYYEKKYQLHNTQKIYESTSKQIQKIQNNNKRNKVF